MSLQDVTPGARAPDEFNVIIEIPMNADPIKYEVDKASGALFVDRFMSTAMHYPCNYGYVPQTLSDDGDPVDVLVITPFPLSLGVVVTCRPIGMLKMRDEAGGDAKLLAVPIDKILPIYQHWQKPEDMNDLRLQPDHSFLRALQRPGTWQVGQGRRLGRAGVGSHRDPRRHRSAIGIGRSRKPPFASPRPGRRFRAALSFTSRHLPC